jgi:hypothetical protein
MSLERSFDVNSGLDVGRVLSLTQTMGDVLGCYSTRESSAWNTKAYPGLKILDFLVSYVPAGMRLGAGTMGEPQ